MEQYFAQTPWEVIVMAVAGLLGAVGYAIRKMVAAQAEKVRIEAQATAKAMIEEAERKSRESRQSLELKLQEFALERDAQRAMNSLMEKLLDQVARSNNAMVMAMERIAVVAEASKQAIVESSAQISERTEIISEHTSTLGELKVSVDALQKVIVELPDTLKGQHEQQGITLQIMLGAVNTLKKAVDTFIENQSKPVANGNATQFPEPEETKSIVKETHDVQAP